MMPIIMVQLIMSHGELTKQASCTIAMVEPNSYLTIEVTSTSIPSSNEGWYNLGETIEYEINVRNDGNLTLTDIDLTSDLTGFTDNITSLSPGSSETFTTSYDIKEEDILIGDVVCIVEAQGTSPDSNNPDITASGEYPEQVAEPNSSLQLNISSISDPMNNEYYQVNEVINLEVEARNDGNLTLSDIDITLQENGQKDTVYSLAPSNTSEPIQMTYTVTAADVQNGSALISFTASAMSPDPDNPEVTAETSTEVPTTA